MSFQDLILVTGGYWDNKYHYLVPSPPRGETRSIKELKSGTKIILGCNRNKKKWPPAEQMTITELSFGNYGYFYTFVNAMTTTKLHLRL